MTKKDLEVCKRLFAQKDEIEQQLADYEQILKWYSENKKEYNLLLSTRNYSNLKDLTVDITGFLTDEELITIQKRMKQKFDTFITLCEGLKWQPPIIPQDLQ